MRPFGNTLAMTTVALYLVIFHIVRVRTEGAAVLLREWNQALTRLVRTFTYALRIPDIVHSGYSFPVKRTSSLRSIP